MLLKKVHEEAIRLMHGIALRSGVQHPNRLLKAKKLKVNFLDYAYLRS